MDLGIREWLMVVGLLLIIFIMLDGFRRARSHRQDKIRMSLNKNFLNSSGDTEPSNSELPNGGARIVGQPQQQPPTVEDDILPPIGDFDGVEDPEYAEDWEDLEGSHTAESLEPQQDTEIAQPIEEVPESIEALETEPAQELVQQSLDLEPEPEVYSVSADNADDQEQEVLVINVAAKQERFKGPDLLHILLACDLRFGDMDIFHRFERAEGQGKVLFSMANSVEPGYFDLDAIDNFTTPSVCFFMSVPGPREPIKAFETMVETAQCVVENLGGEMLDESRSAMTNQTLEHYRQRLQDFERRQLTQA